VIGDGRAGSVGRLRRGHPLATCLATCLALGTVSCSVGQGEGYVRSVRLFVADCWDGSFNLQPTFFGATPFEDTLTIRVQRGERDILVSDGVSLLVYDVDRVRANPGEELRLGLPVGVTPLGFPLPPTPTPPAATLTLYLNNSCRAHNSQLFAVDGTVTFTRLFSGDLNEDNSDARLTEGRFTATVVDPRYAIAREDAESRGIELADAGPAEYGYPSEMTSVINGEFNFVFHRGTPAQPFP
jgi:hypothetical protein